MNRARPIPNRPWAEGDRLWTAAHGSGTLRQWRARPGLNEGLVAFDARPGEARWIVLDNADGRGGEIDLDSAALRDEEAAPLRAEIGACTAGWIDLELTVGVQTALLSLSAVFDPLPKLLAWLEALALGVQECGFDLDEEGRQRTLRASQHDLHHRASATPAVHLVVREGGLDQGGALLLSAQVERRVLVEALYRCLRDFAVSPRYDPSQWEPSVADDEGFVDSGHCGMPLRLWRSEIIERWLGKATPP